MVEIKFEKAMSRCSKKLNEAEKKIEKLTKNQTGEMVSELFPTDPENEPEDDSNE
jgi:exonuclease VII small subunit